MSFAEWFFLFLIFIPLMLIWITTVVDIFMRQDLSGWAKALWVIAVFVFPWIGVLVYLIARPAAAPGAWASKPFEGEGYAPAPIRTQGTSMAQELERITKLHSDGALTDAEYAAAKATVISASAPESKAA